MKKTLVLCTFLPLIVALTCLAAGPWKASGDQSYRVTVATNATTAATLVAYPQDRGWAPLDVMWTTAACFVWYGSEAPTAAQITNCAIVASGTTLHFSKDDEFSRGIWAYPTGAVSAVVNVIGHQ